MTPTGSTRNLSVIRMRLFALWRRRGIFKERHVKEVALMYGKEWLMYRTESSTIVDALKRTAHETARRTAVISVLAPESL